MAAACLVAVATASVIEMHTPQENFSDVRVLPMTPSSLGPSQHLNALRRPAAACPVITAQQCSIESR
jgi:hypothetical protein